MKKQYNLLIFVLLLFFAVLSSCKYDNIVEPAPPSPTDTISFSQQIETIFNSGNNCTSCHTTGQQAPDLSTGNAYNSIVNMNLVNTDSPETSPIYWYVSPDNTSDHTWKKYTTTQAALVLLWIQQGAMDN